MGCVVPLSDEPLNILENDSFAVEWQSKRGFLGSMDWVKTMEQVERHESASEPGVEDSPVTLETILQEYEKPEFMKAEDFQCPKCKQPREGVKRETIWRYPPCLMIQLKRFSYTMKGCIKNDRAIGFPSTDFNIAPYLTPHAEGPVKNLMELLPRLKTDNSHRPQPPTRSSSSKAAQVKYDLYGIISHIGNFSDGHYVAHWHDLNKNKWYYFNDQSCSQVALGDEMIRSNQAYVLFYQLRDMPNVDELHRQSTTQLRDLEAKYGNYAETKPQQHQETL
jgi:uncharacterized UBP type Zn finger protein